MEVAISGYGSVSAAGYGSAAGLAAAANRRTTWRVDAATGLPIYPVVNLPVVTDVDALADRHALDRAAVLALHAARRAVDQAGWRGQEFAILVGCSRGPTASWESSFGEFAGRGRVGLRTSPQTTLGSIGFALARLFGTTGLTDSMSVTCSSGLHALLHGVALLRAGLAERVLVGGTEAALTPFTLRQMEALRVYAQGTPDGAPPCRPLADAASGMAIGEGAAFLALEAANVSASKLRLDGVGFAQEHGESLTGMSADGVGLRTAMAGTLAGTETPDFVVAHAPGTRLGNAAELAALSRVFPRRRPPVTSFKWSTGHTFGASGPLAVCAALRMLEEQRWVGLPYRPGPPPNRLTSALVNATGFGGNSVSVVVRRAAG